MLHMVFMTLNYFKVVKINRLTVTKVRSESLKHSVQHFIVLFWQQRRVFPSSERDLNDLIKRRMKQEGLT